MNSIKLVLVSLIFLHCNAELTAQNFTSTQLKLSEFGDTLLLLPYDLNGKLNGKFIKPDSTEVYKPINTKITYSSKDDLYQRIPIITKGHYINDSLSGEIRRYRMDGSLLEIQNYMNGALHGITQKIDSFGVVINQKNFKTGVLHGESLGFWKKGLVSRRTIYNKGKLESLERYQIKYIEEKDTTIHYLSESYLGEELINHGVWEVYYDNGQIRKSSEFKNGVPTGEWKGWYENGQLKYFMVYSEETIVFFEEYDEKGNVK